MNQFNSTPPGGCLAPRPFGPVPSERQREWHQLDFYGFLHFTVNTFTDREWGHGDEDPAVFHPTDFDGGRIAAAASAAGMRGLIVTCKHHDGFCLWPSETTDHSVKRSPWRNGRGDVVGEIAEACRDHGLLFGIYLSPWDRHHAAYGTAAYLDDYRAQLDELLTRYGPVFEVWFDGANGGDGYYGGARETRRIDRHKYYGWNGLWERVRELQPQACVFSDVGPDIRWVGNEKGIAGEPCWQTLSPAGFAPGDAEVQALNHGHRQGTHWLPAECDVSIRPGWFYHAAEDGQVRDAENLSDLYLNSVGRGASLLLNLPPDRRGHIHENDQAALQAFCHRRNRIFKTDLAHQAAADTEHFRGRHPAFAADRMIDGNPESYWATDDTMTAADAILTFDHPIDFNMVGLREYLPLGQRVDRFAIDVEHHGQWTEYCQGTSIGNRRLVLGKHCRTSRIRLRVIEARVCPAIREFSLYLDKG